MKKRCLSRVSNMVNSTLNMKYLRCLWKFTVEMKLPSRRFKVGI